MKPTAQNIFYSNKIQIYNIFFFCRHNADIRAHLPEVRLPDDAETADRQVQGREGQDAAREADPGAHPLPALPHAPGGGDLQPR